MSTSLLRKAFKATLATKTPVIHARFGGSRFQSAAAAVAQAAPDAVDNDVRPFETLKEVISPKTYQALVGEPMKLRNMTAVQTSVLSRLPEISEPHNPSSPVVRDFLVRAKTGTGKTLAFLIPAIEAREKAIKQAGKQALLDSGLMSDDGLERRARRKYSRETVGVLILSPTRELATQIAKEALRLLHHHDGIEVRLITGGVNKRLQMRDWMKGNRDVVVATTGRLRDLMASEPEVLKSIRTAQTFILDEADTMLDMGFRDDIHAIQEELPPSPTRQTLLFSATVSPVIRQVATTVLARDHKIIDCVKSDDSPVHAHVPQYHTVLPSAASQLPHIMRLIAHDQLTNPKSKIILFLPTAKMTQLFSVVVRKLAKELFPTKTNVYEIHSKCVMQSRIRASDMFRQDRSPASILVTSDISARGVDYPGVTRVIQVGVPATTEQYIHRIGRTGRTGGVIGRGDLVLLPWEIGFITWQLTEVPIKPVTAGEITHQVEELAKQADSEPKSRPHIQTPYTPRLSDLESAPLELMRNFDEDAIRETFLAMLGYYTPKSPELRVQRGVIFEGCKDWTVQACGLETPPYLNPGFLDKLGLGESQKRKPTRSYSSSGRPHWEGRGSRSTKGFQNERSKSYSPGYDSEKRGNSWSRDSGSSSRFRDTNENGNSSSWSRSRDNNENRGNRSRDGDDSRGKSWSRGNEYGERTSRYDGNRREYKPRTGNW
ncbi:DEAD-domain-containing protein [Lentinula detonsa]|uniref:ATP-dependent RNA helicase n=1 Tax=Lentinula detonsa TaxID=2804962 RepID=A0A9W8U115_9AGAR|nr:DEAD-domain-containing protein [Lentinula detonsa]KAJ3987015.1 DEAD-domain-containing protein [Lentinula detonsa]